MDRLKPSLISHIANVLDEPTTSYRRDATCRYCGAEYGIDPHRESCQWEIARLALHLLARAPERD
jgi:hypothetical protein